MAGPQGQQLTVNIQTKDILGLLPGIDRKQSDKPFIVDGKNFLFGGKGPYSGFGRILATKAPLPNPTLAQSFRTVNDKGFIFTRDTIYGYDTVSMSFYPVFSFTPQTDIQLWTECFVANKHYYARKGVGVVEYNPTSGAWTLMVNANLPAGALSVANVRGRLVILGDFAYVWSALDDPNDLSPSLTTGAGLQSLAILGGTAFKIIPLSDNFLVFTSRGIIIAEFSGGAAIFRHRVLTTKFKAVNAACIEELDNGVAVFLDEDGLFTCNGKIPEVFDALFSEFLRATLLKEIKSTNFNNYRLEAGSVGHAKVMFKLLVSTLGSDTTYERVYFMYRPIGKFGTFDDSTLGFIELPVDRGVSIDFQLCTIDPSGLVLTFNNFGDINYIEGTVLPDNGIFWQADFDMPANVQSGTVHFPSVITVSAEKLWMFEGLASGWYYIGDQIVARSF